MSRGAHWNRNSRRSGGDRRARIVVGTTSSPQPLVAIQCFEGRHKDCGGVDTLMGGAPCECRCHAKHPPQPPEPA